MARPFFAGSKFGSASKAAKEAIKEVGKFIGTDGGRAAIRQQAERGLKHFADSERVQGRIRSVLNAL